MEFNFLDLISVQENCNRLATDGNIGCVSEGDGSENLRNTFALGLQMIAEFKLHLVFLGGNCCVDVQMARRGVIENHLLFYIPTIPIFEEAHNGNSLFRIFLNVFDTLCTEWKLKINTWSTENEPNITGYNGGFMTQLPNVAWRDFELFTVVTTIIEWMQRHEKLIKSMGTNLTYYINDRWSFSKDAQVASGKYQYSVRFINVKLVTQIPSPWLVDCLYDQSELPNLSQHRVGRILNQLGYCIQSVQHHAEATPTTEVALLCQARSLLTSMHHWLLLATMFQLVS